MFARYLTQTKDRLDIFGEDAIEEIRGDSLKAFAGENTSLQELEKLVELAAHSSASHRPAT